MPTYTGRGCSTHLTEMSAIYSKVSHIRGTCSLGGFTGESGSDLLDRYSKSVGGDVHKVSAFADKIATEYGR